jgi:hypothetical protein
MWASLQDFWHWWVLLPWSVWFDQTDKGVRILAVVLGGGWAYWKFARGRVFHTRLEPTVSGRCFEDRRGDYVIATIKLKNVGASKLDLQSKGTVLIVEGCARSKESAPERPVDWFTINIKSIFEDHTGVEPSETIESSVLVDLPPHLIAVRLEARVVANGIESTANTIIEAPADKPTLS